jgi:hypothetical protein
MNEWRMNETERRINFVRGALDGWPGVGRTKHRASMQLSASLCCCVLLLMVELNSLVGVFLFVASLFFFFFVWCRCSA